MRTRCIALILALSVSSACGDSPSPAAPTAPAVTASVPVPLNLSGIWRGTYASAVIGYGTATLSLSQIGTQMSGTWSTIPSPGGGNGAGSGTVSGVNPLLAGSSGTFTLFFAASNPQSCPYQATMTMVGSNLDGNWVTVNCTVSASGTLILSKQ